MSTAYAGLSGEEAAFLEKLAAGQWLLRNNKASEKIQCLVDRGYCRTAKMRSGPLGIYTGEIGLLITEAGKLALGAKEQP